MLCSCKHFVGFILLITMGSLCPMQVCGQPSALNDAPRGPWVPSPQALGQDALDIVEAPFEMSQSQKLLTVGAVGVVASTAIVLDQPAYHRVSRRSGPLSNATHSLAGPGRWYDRVGPDRAALGTAGFLAVSGIALQRRDFTRTSVRVLEALLYTKAVTGLAKSAVNRTRPFVGAGPHTADPGAFSSNHNELSMPSGHTARAFAVASVLAHEFDRWYVSAPVYGMATSVAAERVRSGDHWLTDVMVGGALGYLIGRSISPNPSQQDAVTYTPVLSTNRVGVSVQF